MRLESLHEEMASLSFSAIERRRMAPEPHGVWRAELMNSMGFADLPILSSTFRHPIWPAGVIGSMAHNDRIAVAAVGLGVTSMRSASISNLPRRAAGHARTDRHAAGEASDC